MVADKLLWLGTTAGTVLAAEHAILIWLQMYCRWVMYNQHQAALLELQRNNLHNQIDLKALSEPVDQV